MKKKLILALDGTWQDGATVADRGKATNIWKLARAINRNDEEGCHQIVYYQSGVGTSDWTYGELVTNAVKTFVEGATGAGLATKVKEAYQFIARNWQPGDEIFIFGFSRGAYTARAVASIIGDIGLLGKADQEEFWKIYENYQLAGAKNAETRKKAETFLLPWRMKKAAWEAENVTQKFSIKVLGVFDTVGAMGIPGFVPKEINFFGFNDLKLGSYIENAFHAMALNENRNTFPITKWQFDQSHQPAKGQTVKQVWFGGSHSDIGGGWPDSDLAMIPLVWMASNVKRFLSLDTQYLLHDVNFKPYRPWGNLRPHNPMIDILKIHSRLISNFRSQSIALSANDSDSEYGAVELIHESVFQQDVRNAPELWPEALRAMIKKFKGSRFVDVLDPMEEELRDGAFMTQIRVGGKGSLPDGSALDNVEPGLQRIMKIASTTPCDLDAIASHDILPLVGIESLYTAPKIFG